VPDIRQLRRGGVIAHCRLASGIPDAGARCDPRKGLIMLFRKFVTGALAAGVTLGAVALAMEPAAAAPAPKPAIKLLVCKKGQVAYRVKVGHHHVWRCHVAPHHVRHHAKPLPKKPLPPKKS
jgi:hypothetical protein